MTMMLNRTLLKSRFLARQQHRQITTYLKDVLRTRSLSPTNPLVEALTPRKGADLETANSETQEPSSVLTELPSLSEIQPYHVADAAATVKKAMPSGDAPLLQRINTMEARVESLRQISNLLWLMSSDASQKAHWRRALNELSNVLFSADSVSNKEEEEVYTALQDFVQQEQNDEDESVAAVRNWMREYEQRTGNHLAGGDDDDDGDDKKNEFSMLQAALEEVQVDFQESSSSETSTFAMSPVAQKKFLGDMYNFIGIRNRQAELLGFANFSEQVMQSNNRMASVEQVRELHQQVAEVIVPLIHVATPQKNTMLESYLSSPGAANGPKKQPNEKQRSDRFAMLRLQEHVTLDGALLFLFRLSQDLFGVSIVEDEAGSSMGWHSDVRLFHMIDENDNSRHLGSFYLDPYERAGKLDRPVTLPLFSRGSLTDVPVVALSLAIEPPAWDTESAPMTWDDVESLFHEMGHIYQFLLARPELGALMGPDKMPFDLSELLPKFMEHWMTERSTIYTLIGASQGRGTLQDEASMDEMIDAAFRVRSQEKALRLAQQTFFGTLELALFTEFDIRGEESMLSLQHRLALELVPHDLPDEKNIGPLLDIFRENSSGRHVGWYRYLWGDAMSATLFDKFKLAYTEDGSSLRKLKDAFRRVVLEPGGALNPEEIMSEFELQDCSPKSLLERHNLIKS